MIVSVLSPEALAVGLELVDEGGAMLMRADLPPLPAADRALEEVRGGKTTGLSIEFRAIKERVEAGIRVIEEALIVGVAIVKSPSYTGSCVEARAGRRRVWL